MKAKKQTEKTMRKRYSDEFKEHRFASDTPCDAATRVLVLPAPAQACTPIFRPSRIAVMIASCSGVLQ